MYICNGNFSILVLNPLDVQIKIFSDKYNKLKNSTDDECIFLNNVYIQTKKNLEVTKIQNKRFVICFLLTEYWRIMIFYKPMMISHKAVKDFRWHFSHVPYYIALLRVVE